MFTDDELDGLREQFQAALQEHHEGALQFLVTEAQVGIVASKLLEDDPRQELLVGEVQILQNHLSL